MMNSWTLLRLNPQNQSKYVEHALDMYPEIGLYYPIFEKITRPARCRHPILVSCPVYPGYVFVNIDLDSRLVHALVSCPVKARFIRFGGIIGKIPDMVIVELRKLELAKQLVREQFRVNPYTPGRQVRVHTPVADISAVIIRLVNQSKAIVDSPLGTITVGIHQIQFA